MKTQRVVLLLAVVCVGCGDEDSGGALEGPFVQVSGYLARSFSLDPGQTSVLCRPKPGLSEFEYEAGVGGGADSLRLVYKAFDGPGSFELEYGVSKPQHVIEVTLAGAEDLRFKFFRHLRSDTSEVYNSFCELKLSAEALAASTRYEGTLVCTMLWADTGTDAYDATSPLNSYVDLVARFGCEY